MLQLILFCGILVLGSALQVQAAEKEKPQITLVIHGGAGTILREQMTPEKEKAYREALQSALQSGFAVLQKNGAALDAVQTAIRILEDSPLFNAGKGSVFNSEGKIEMDASIMDGSTLKAGAVAAVTNIKNPILAARAVMDQSPHVMLMGKGAEDFAKEHAIELVDPSYFYTDFRYQQLLKEKEKQRQLQNQSQPSAQTQSNHLGTVGAVALDARGNLAAGTSTGGTTNKLYGRIGDSPVIGAGTYASNNTCAVSATGDGEYFLRTVAAYRISALMEYNHLSAQQASEQVLQQIQLLGGNGGVIVLDHEGNFALTFNTAGMYRGYITAGGKMQIDIYK